MTVLSKTPVNDTVNDTVMDPLWTRNSMNGVFGHRVVTKRSLVNTGLVL